MTPMLEQEARPRARLILPPPTGPHPVGLTAVHLVDETRRDPRRPDRHRELMVTFTYPARATAAHPAAPWLSPGVAPYLEARLAQPDVGVPASTADWADVPSHCAAEAPVDRQSGRLPVLLYSPGFGSPRTLQTVLISELASRGYLVVSIDHTFEAMAVEFPGGRVEPEIPLERTLAFFETAFQARMDDVQFVLGQLVRLRAGENPDADRKILPPGLIGAPDLLRIGMFGHSCGGFTTAETMVRDPRIRAGVSAEGTLVFSGDPYLPGQAPQRGLTQPFVLMGSQLRDEHGEVVDHTHGNGTDQSWTDFWNNRRGWTLALVLKGSRHYSFTDLGVVVPQLAEALNLPPGHIEQIVGTIPAHRAVVTQATYISAFFDRFLRDQDTGLLDAPSADFPEVEFVP